MARGDFNARQLALIKSARSLESDARPFDHKINDIWQQLSAAKGGKSCAAEETILRWLLKHMDSSSDIAEQLRRYPATWTTIGCLFERISLFSLSRIFLERKFIAVLQQSARDISRPQSQEKTRPSKEKKRKRDEPLTFDLATLRLPETLLQSASELFGALEKLLQRLNTTRDRHSEHVLIGAEHIKSLFRVPAEAAKDLVAPLLWICAHSLSLLPHDGIVEQQETWPKTVVAFWDLHLGSAEDSHEFAASLYNPCCTILDALSGPDKVKGNLLRKGSWLQQMRQFVTKNLINPARSTFTNGKGLGALEIANSTTLKDPAPSIKILSHLLSLSQQGLDDPITKRERLTWTSAVFKLLLTFAEEHNVAEHVITNLMSNATRGCQPDLETLRHVCKSYALQAATNWSLVADIISCDSDTFLLDEELFDALLASVTSVTKAEEFELEEIVEGVINPLMKAAAKARNLINFIKKWHGQISQLLSKGESLDQSPWYDARAREQCADLLQGTLSIQQVSSLVDRLQEEDDSEAYLIVLDAICQGITDEDYIDAIKSNLLDIVLQPSNNPAQVSSVLTPRWRITRKTTSWVAAADVNRIWDHVKANLSRLLSSGSLSDTATFEAFACCCELSHANYPQGDKLKDTLAEACTFLKRIIAEVKDENRFPVVSRYIDLVFNQFPAISQASSGEEQISNLLGILFNRIESNAAKIMVRPSETILQRVPKDDAVQDDEEIVEALIQPLISKLESSDVCGWTGSATSSTTISALLDFPPEVFTKDRRKRIMSSWRNRKTEVEAGSREFPIAHERILRLLILVMTQPTFYDGMAFDDVQGLLVNISSELLPFLEKLALLMIGQMVRNVESSATYLDQILRYIEGLDIEQTDNPIMPLIVLKSVVIALQGSSTKAKHGLNQEQVAEKLRELVGHSIAEFSSKLKKPGKFAKSEDDLMVLDLTLRAAAVIGDRLSAQPIKLSSKVVARLQDAGHTLSSEGVPTGWKLFTFLTYNKGVSSSDILLKQMSQEYSSSADSLAINEFVDASIKDLDASARTSLLHDLLKDCSSWQNPSIPYTVLGRIIEAIQVSAPLSAVTEEGKTFDLASVQVILCNSLARKTRTLEQFQNTAQVIELLLDKHASSMTQVNIEHTMAVVAAVCSSEGPRLSDPESSVAGGVFDTLYRLTAIIIKRHRLRLEGHHHLLVSTLQTLLRVLLANPAKSKQTNSSFLYPPWLDTRLKARHGAKFARLLTLVCEPSAASVARGKHNSLDSATDAVKRSAGQHMFWVIALYIKLQLEGDVSRDVRKELATGVYSILGITPDSNRRILSEAVDESGRAIFRSLFTEWKKFGKWSGV
ncbi:Urb2/Npa2 family-domain-containing protein [Truncatella angustata]|uniref:Urb2/Npa2 family-domain-containing protein n=1 Tax=Truncatella angustata TaxID=152316 RepID=A0A9P9A2G2_9PEZI|nr:Urb2/Npa2 family-domain-containing protein [Truncatella angustata]KAH6658176.1 Urb2/Npa2 family-domain-containing protein [Truncatella angustata]